MAGNVLNLKHFDIYYYMVKKNIWGLESVVFVLGFV